MMRVGDQTGDGTQDSGGLDLEMGSGDLNMRLVQSDVRVILFVDIEVLD